MGRNPQITFVYGRRHQRWVVAAPITYEQILRCSVYINLVYFVYENLDWPIVRYRVLCKTCSIQHNLTTVYPKKYAHGFCFAVLCCGFTLTDFLISTRLTSLALWQSNDCPSASKATLMNMDKYFMWVHYERLHNHNKAKHKKTVCIFLGIYCNWDQVTYIRPWISPSLVLVMASPQIGPISWPVLVYCWLNRWEQIFVHLKWKIASTLIMKNERCRLYNDGILSWPQCGRSAVYPKISKYQNHMTSQSNPTRLKFTFWWKIPPNEKILDIRIRIFKDL